MKNYLIQCCSDLNCKIFVSLAHGLLELFMMPLEQGSRKQQSIMMTVSAAAIYCADANFTAKMGLKGCTIL
jgi:hypothetical protein